MLVLQRYGHTIEISGPGDPHPWWCPVGRPTSRVTHDDPWLLSAYDGDGTLVEDLITYVPDHIQQVPIPWQSRHLRIRDAEGDITACWGMDPELLENVSVSMRGSIRILHGAFKSIRHVSP